MQARYYATVLNRSYNRAGQYNNYADAPDPTLTSEIIFEAEKGGIAYNGSGIAEVRAIAVP